MSGRLGAVSSPGLPERRPPATLYDVAREAEVSIATVSRALNGATNRRVKDHYYARVVAAAEKLGYTPNQSAQSMARGATRTVALLVSDIADPFYSSIAAGVIRVADQEGFQVSIGVTERDLRREYELVRLLRSQRPQVVALAGSRFDDESGRDRLVRELNLYLRSGGRVVTISEPELPFPTLRIDNSGGARRLATRLVDLGYKGFAILGGPPDLATTRIRVDSFAEALAGFGIRPRYVAHGDFNADGGRELMQGLADRGLDDVDLIFAANDLMAVGALSVLRERGYSVPEDVGLAGFDDIVMARIVTPALTTVAIPLEDVGEAALRLALNEPTSSLAKVPVEVVVRASTPQR